MDQPRTIDSVAERVKIGLYIIRWIVIILVLLESQLSFTTVRIERREIVTAVAIIAGLTLLFSLVVSRRFRVLGGLANTIADIIFVSVVVYFSGGLSSPFYPLYYIVLIVAAVIFGTKGAMWSALAIGLISLIIQYALKNWVLSELLIIDEVARTFPYLFLTALIAGALRDRIQALAEINIRLESERAASNREMDVARRVQQAQLPQGIPDIDGIEIALLYNPAREVGGDLYEFYPVEESRLGIAVADVAGKGVPAALLVASAKYGLYEHFSEDMAKMAAEVNHHLISVTPIESFVTLVYGILDVNNRNFRYLNAGHMPPMVLRNDGRVECCETGEVPLGVLEPAEYFEHFINLEPGDVLVLYSDGITDALEEADGLNALASLLAELHGNHISTWGAKLMAKIGRPSHLDDMTLIAVRIKPLS